MMWRVPSSGAKDEAQTVGEKMSPVRKWAWREARSRKRS